MLEELMRIVELWPGVTFDIKWEHHLCFNVGGKIFFIASPDEVPINASFKVREEDFIDWSSKDGVIQAPYFAKKQWVRIDDITRLDLSNWKDALHISYTEISLKLTKKLRKEIGIDE